MPKRGPFLPGVHAKTLLGPKRALLPRHIIREPERRGAFVVGQPMQNSAAVTPAVRVFSQRLRASLGINRSATPQNMEKTLVWLAKNIKFEQVKRSDGKAVYGITTAEDVLKARKIMAVFYKKEPIFGCAQICDAAIALLKTIPGVWNIKHIRTVTVTETPHSVVYFELPNPMERGGPNWRFLSDPFVNGEMFLGSPMAQIGAELRQKIRALKQKGRWQEGKCLWDFNLGYDDYLKEHDFLQKHSRLPTQRERSALRRRD